MSSKLREVSDWCDESDWKTQQIFRLINSKPSHHLCAIRTIRNAGCQNISENKCENVRESPRPVAKEESLFHLAGRCARARMTHDTLYVVNTERQRPLPELAVNKRYSSNSDLVMK